MTLPDPRKAIVEVNTTSFSGKAFSVNSGSGKFSSPSGQSGRARQKPRR